MCVCVFSRLRRLRRLTACYCVLVSAAPTSLPPSLSPSLPHSLPPSLPPSLSLSLSQVRAVTRGLRPVRHFQWRHIMNEPREGRHASHHLSTSTHGIFLQQNEATSRGAAAEPKAAFPQGQACTSAFPQGQACTSASPPRAL